MPNANANVHKWLGRAPIAHAHTLLITSRKRDFLRHSVNVSDGATPEETEQALWNAAWAYLMQAHYVPVVDVDLECLAALEERMFEVSSRAGAAGNHQWGLDAGEHQDKWCPYTELPIHWNHEDRDEHESELEVCVNLYYIFVSNPMLVAAWLTIQCWR